MRMTKFWINTAFLHYLEHSYRYYALNEPTISDELYDKLCKFLLDNYKEAVQSHPWHKNCGVSRHVLRCGSGYCLKYPTLLIECVEKHDGFNLGRK
jgi:hypothetical protein